MQGIKWTFNFLATIKSLNLLSHRPAVRPNPIYLAKKIVELNKASKLKIAKDIYHALSLGTQSVYKEECLETKLSNIENLKVDFNLKNLFSRPQINERKKGYKCGIDMDEDLLKTPIYYELFYQRFIAPSRKQTVNMCHSCREAMADLFHQIKNQLGSIYCDFIIAEIIISGRLNIFLLLISNEDFDSLIENYNRLLNFNSLDLKFFKDLFSKALEIYHAADNRQLLIKLYGRFALLEEYFKPPRSDANKEPQSDDNFLFRFYKNHSHNLGLNYLDDEKKLWLFKSMITYLLEKTKTQELAELLKSLNFTLPYINEKEEIDRIFNSSNPISELKQHLFIEENTPEYSLIKAHDYLDRQRPNFKLDSPATQYAIVSEIINANNLPFAVDFLQEMLSDTSKTSWQALYLIDLSYIFNYFIKNLPSVVSIEFYKTVNNNQSYKVEANRFEATEESQSNGAEFYNELVGNEIEELFSNLNSKCSVCNAEDFYSFLMVYKSITSKNKKTSPDDAYTSAVADTKIINIFSNRLKDFHPFDNPHCFLKNIDKYYCSFLLYPLEAYTCIVARYPSFIESVIEQITSYLVDPSSNNSEFATKPYKWLFFIFQLVKTDPNFKNFHMILKRLSEVFEFPQKDSNRCLRATFILRFVVENKTISGLLILCQNLDHRTFRKEYYDLAIYLLFFKRKYDANDAIKCIEQLLKHPHVLFIYKFKIFQNCIEMFFDILKNDENSLNRINNEIISKLHKFSLFKLEFYSWFPSIFNTTGVQNVCVYPCEINHISLLYSVPIIFKNAKARKNFLFPNLRECVKNSLTFILTNSLISSDFLFQIFEIILDSSNPKKLIEFLESDSFLNFNYRDKLQKFFYRLNELYLLNQKKSASKGYNSAVSGNDIDAPKKPIYFDSNYLLGVAQNRYF